MRRITVEITDEVDDAVYINIAEGIGVLLSALFPHHKPDARVLIDNKMDTETANLRRLMWPSWKTQPASAIPDPDQEETMLEWLDKKVNGDLNEVMDELSKRGGELLRSCEPHRT